jgi:riboflavin kinase/FMN adenylyltransferase
MNIIKGTNNTISEKNTIVTIGTFDGLHHGHRKILARLRELQAENPDFATVLMTFHPHPRTIVGRDEVRLLSDIDEKIALTAAENIDFMLILPFDKKMSEMSPEEFVNEILLKILKTKILVIGYDHKFGKDRAGNYQFLKENEKKFGFEVIEISRQEIEDVAVSSTKIRNALLEGNIRIANDYLQRPYSIRGKVVQGNQIGRKLGFPTANIALLEEQKLVPANGIYAVRVRVSEKMYDGVLAVGVRPTIGENLHKTIEVNIFDFSEDIYTQTIEVFFYDFIRSELKFEDLDALVKKMHEDKSKALNILSLI